MRLIDADALMGMVFNDVVLIDGDVKGAGLILADAVEEAPTVDAEAVVRCRDCKYFMEYTREYAQNAYGADGDCYIRVMNSCNEQFRSCNYDGFCSCGVKMDEEDKKQ